MAGKIVVVVTEQMDESVLADALRGRIEPGDEVRLVASPTVSGLAWLTNDEDAQRDQAEELAARAGSRLGENVLVHPGVGDVDAVQAVEDTLRTFPAERVLVIRPAGAPDRPEEFAGLAAPVEVVTVGQRP